MLLSIIIPARNEEGCIVETLDKFSRALEDASIRYELVVVDDGSTDSTAALVRSFATERPGGVLVTNTGRNGFGAAIREGLRCATGEAVAIVMADGSDSPADMVTYYRILQQGYD